MKFKNKLLIFQDKKRKELEEADNNLVNEK